MARIKNDYDFLSGVYIDGRLTFNKFRLTLDISAYGNHEDKNIAFERINYFIYEVIQSSVFISESEDAVIEKYKNVGISMLSVPAPGPVDQVIQAVLITKINAMLDDVLDITDSEINSVQGGYISYIWDFVDEDDPIHGLINNEDDDKWWACAEPRFISNDEDGVHTIGANWKDLNLHWYVEGEEMIPAEESEKEKDEEVVSLEDIDRSETVIMMSDFNEDG